MPRKLVVLLGPIPGQHGGVGECGCWDARCGALWLGSPWEPKLSWGSLGEVCGFSLPNALRSEQVEVKLHLEFM